MILDTSTEMSANYAHPLPMHDVNGMHAEETQNMLPINTMRDVNENFGVEWNSGICGCCTCERPWICCMACLCPCLLFGEIHHAVYNSGVAGNTKNSTCMPNVRCNAAACEFCLLDCPLSVAVGLCCTYAVGCSVSIPSMSCCPHSMTRRHIRQNNAKGAISGNSLFDVVFTFFCSCCSLIQEHRQLFPQT